MFYTRLVGHYRRPRHTRSACVCVGEGGAKGAAWIDGGWLLPFIISTVDGPAVAEKVCVIRWIGFSNEP